VDGWEDMRCSEAKLKIKSKRLNHSRFLYVGSLVYGLGKTEGFVKLEIK